MAADFGVEQVVTREDLTLPVAPIDRIARLRIDDRYRVGVDARVALADILEDYADNVASAAATLARHADRRTVQAEDIETYFALFE
jgi:histone H3/H4